MRDGGIPQDAGLSVLPVVRLAQKTVQIVVRADLFAAIRQPPVNLGQPRVFLRSGQRVVERSAVRLVEIMEASPATVPGALARTFEKFSVDVRVGK